MKTKVKNNLFVAISCAALIAGSSPATAQSIDYTTMEELFGEPVTTSATGKPQRMSEVPVTMEILTAEDIRRSGATNVAEALRQVNGVNVVQRTEFTYDVAIRGYNQPLSQRLLVLVNGRQVYLDLYGYTDWSSLPVQLDEIRQIEVVKGPNTALFGFNAVNGVINIVTYNPLYDDVSSAGLTVGTDNYRQASFAQTLRFNDKVASRVSAGMKKSDGFDNDVNSGPSLALPSSDSGFVEPETEALFVDTMMQVTDHSQLRLEIAGTNTETGLLILTGNLVNIDYETKSAKLSYELDSHYGLIKANIYKNFLDADLETITIGADIENDVLVAQLENTIELNKDHTVRVQGEYRENELSGAGFTPAGAETSYEVYALSGMWNWLINKDWTWTNAVRVDYLELDHNGIFSGASPYTAEDYDQDMTEYSYNSGLVWKASEKDTLRLNTGRGLEIPSLIEYASDLALGPVILGGNPYLDPAVVTNYELAWDRKINEIEGLLRLAVFYNETEDVKASDGLASPPLFFSDNIGESTSYGFEVELEGKYKEHFDWGLGYIYQKIDDDLDNGKTPTSLTVGKDFEEGNPRHTIKASLGYKNGPWEADTLFYYVSETDQYALPPASLGFYAFEEIDDYISANGRIAYTFEDSDVTIAIQGQQLLHNQLQTSVSPDINRQVFVSLSKEF